ncbi:MAG: rhodanese-related sulfurtransferase [Chlamydiia bacterium]|nr:rhodanese-related sulfurtransferase [Chlamydiia bacterium]
MTYKVLAFYCFCTIDEPEREVKRWKKFLEGLDAKGRIYLNGEGINAQMSILEKDLPKFVSWLGEDVRYGGIEIKVHETEEHAFAKMTVKFREQLVAMDCDYDLSKGGKRLSPKEWAAMIESKDEETVILDVRNDYEWEVGHFEGAEKPCMETFREFPEYAKKLREKRDPKKTKVMMYCTGGIRCELYSCLLKEEGFDEVFQLEGGVIKYGQDVGQKHWKGKLFVFDDRLVVPISPEGKNEVISTCAHCETSSDTYYNCANMDCNALFISCLSCVEKMQGCCSEECISAPRRRPIEVTPNPKPFRKLSFEEKSKLQDSSSCQSAQ